MFKDALTINIPISKIDEEQRIVTGIATSEALDSQGDIIDYEASKEAFKSWVGNIREMHNPIAIGKTIDVQFDDRNKQVIISAKISESEDGQNAWTKVKEGVLTGFSIGGRVAKIVKDKAVSGANRIVEYSLSETSLVDNPANPEAQLLMVKSKDGKLQRVEDLTKIGTNVVDGDARDHNAATVTEVVNGPAPVKGGTKVLKLVYSKDGRTTTAKEADGEMKKSVWDASEAIDIACKLSYLMMIESEENDLDQMADLKTAFDAIKDFIAREVIESDDYEVEAAEVMEMAQKAINLRKGKEVSKEEVKKAEDEVVAVKKDSTDDFDEAVLIVNEDSVAEDKVAEEADTDEAEVVKEDSEEIVEEVKVESKEEVADEVVAADETKVDDKEEKSDVAQDLVKSVHSLISKFDENTGAELRKVADMVGDLSGKVEKQFASLEGRIRSLEDLPAATKAKASYAVVEKNGVESEESESIAELEKRQDHLASHPQDAKPGEFEEIFRKMRQLRSSN